MRNIRIFDTTLRDGEQSPGASMNVEEKIQVAKQLARLGVDVIEAGFAVSSPGDFEAVKRIGLEVEGPIVCSLARAKEADIKKAAEALKDAPRKRIHTFHSTSDIHLKYQFRVGREEALRRSAEMVSLARGLVEDVEFSPMDATRTDLPYLLEVVSAVIEAGASTVNIPDTVGYTTPEEFGDQRPHRRQRGHLGTLSQRFGSCSRKLPFRRPERRGTSGVHDQRDRGARRQLFYGRGGDGAEDEEGLLRRGHRHRHAGDHAFQQADHQDYGDTRSAQQGDSRGERVCT
jgi:hypothetical protein